MPNIKNNDVESLLRQITSTHMLEENESSRNEQGASIKALGGAPTNNMLLSMIYAETKRNADATTDLSTYMRQTNALLEKQQEILGSLATSIDSLSSVLALSARADSKKANSALLAVTDKDKVHYYNASPLTSKNHLYACIISHLISMVYVRMRRKAIMYGDSVDCSFEMLAHAVRVVSGTRCRISSVVYDNKITLAEKNTPVMKSMLPYIASTKQDDNTTLPESRVLKIYNDSTSEDVFVHIRFLVERLCCLDGILSPKQMDAMKSFMFPLVIIRDGEEPTLNIDESKWTCSMSHPVTNMVAGLIHTKKIAYIDRIMLGDSPAKAYAVVSTDGSKKK
jgi:hypothetical protein